MRIENNMQGGVNMDSKIRQYWEVRFSLAYGKL